MPLPDLNFRKRAAGNIAAAKLKFSCYLFLCHAAGFTCPSYIAAKQLLVFRIHYTTPYIPFGENIFKSIDIILSA